MKTIERLQNPVQDYAWGSPTAIPELLGRNNPSRVPQAELWMGAHPKSPSHVLHEGKWTSLIEVIRRSPEAILGKGIAKKYSNRLPFLFKVLAASKPLSIQAHPSRQQAREGFCREDELALPITSEERNYRDTNHKPEIICALQPFWALSGFRKIEKILSHLRDLRPSLLAQEISAFAEQPNQAGLKEFFGTLLRNNAERSHRVVAEILEAVEQVPDYTEERRWMLRLQEDFPGDIGVVSPLLLNLVRLEPQEALYLPAGVLHAYLEGVGIELMANSDNVLRGGLTTKHIDVDELLRVVSFESQEIDILSPSRTPTGEKLYRTPAEEFRLTSIDLKASAPFTSRADRGVEILICVSGTAEVEIPPEKSTLDLDRGDSVLVPAAVEQYRLRGQAFIFRADVPPQSTSHHR